MCRSTHTSVSFYIFKKAWRTHGVVNYDLWSYDCKQNNGVDECPGTTDAGKLSEAVF